MFLHLFHLHTGRPILITPEGQYWEKGNFSTPKLDETEGFLCLGHSNWTICRLLSHFCCQTFTISSFSYWKANSYYPRGLIMEKWNFPNPKTEWDRGVCVPGLSNWTICSPFSPFCSKNFPSFSPSYWGAISYYPRWPIMGDSPSFRIGCHKCIETSPFADHFVLKFSHLFYHHTGEPFLYTQEGQ